MANNMSSSPWPLLELRELGELNRGRSRIRPRRAAHLYGGTYPFIQRVKQRVKDVATGSTQLHLNPESVGEVKIPVPSLQTQRRNAHILGTLDDKIELNRRMNETLETMARRLFRSGFIDFDPVHAKAAVRREHPKLSNADLSRRALPNMAPEIAELFPDSFEDSTLGPIPKGWNVAKLCDHTEATRGLSYKGSGLSEAGMALHNLNSVFEGGGYKCEEIKFYSGEFQSRHRISPGDVIVANTEQGHDCRLLGYAAIVPDVFGNQGLFGHPLLSEDRRETFMLDIHSGRINFSKITFQNRGRQVVVLVRLDIAGPPHRNPDGEEVSCPHWHVYREGFGDKWAVTAPIDKFTALNDHWKTLHDFMQFCSIVTPPAFRKGLFT